MSTDSVEAEAAADMCCASCGTAQVDDIKLKKCDACDLVHYCSDNCKQLHRSEHEHPCKERAAELRDEILFRQPESTHLGDCPICFLPLRTDHAKSMMIVCCSKIICDGCVYADKRHRHRENLQQTCPFCRHPIRKIDEEANKKLMKRAAANDLVAMRQIGLKHYGEDDYVRAFEYWSKAAQLGDIDAHYELSLLYTQGQGVEKDDKMQMYHSEEAAIGGDPRSRIILAHCEWKNKRFDRAVKHLIIAANLGHYTATRALKLCYAEGHVSKEVFAAALRAHQAAVDATKSPQREKAAAADCY
mmetsp:Transcript_11236/g.22424  ORF Transcript_11236/g.22424 Transcript_11236/m.22424 type:complete len:302 (-) Transcript_11236:152-1057(-)